MHLHIIVRIRRRVIGSQAGGPDPDVAPQERRNYMIRRCRLPAAVLFADNETLEQVNTALTLLQITCRVRQPVTILGTASQGFRMSG